MRLRNDGRRLVCNITGVIVITRTFGGQGQNHRVSNRLIDKVQNRRESFYPLSSPDRKTVDSRIYTIHTSAIDGGIQSRCPTKIRF